MNVITLVVDKYMFYVFLIIIIGALIVNMFFLRFAYLKKKAYCSSYYWQIFINDNNDS